MQLGISTYTYTWAVGVPGYPPVQPITVDDLLMTASKYDIGVVQICDNIPLHQLSQYQLERIGQKAGLLGIEIEVGTRGVESDHLLRYLDIAEILRSKFLRVILQKTRGNINIDEAFIFLKEVLRRFEAKGISIGVENHERHKVEELVELIERLDSPYAGICLDTVNSFGALECPDYVINTLAPYTINLHIKDYQIERLNHQMGFEITGCPAGNGRLNIKDIMNIIKGYGKNPNAILELWTPFTETLERTIQREKEWAHQSIIFLKELIG